MDCRYRRALIWILAVLIVSLLVVPILHAAGDHPCSAIGCALCSLHTAFACSVPGGLRLTLGNARRILACTRPVAAPSFRILGPAAPRAPPRG